MKNKCPKKKKKKKKNYVTLNANKIKFNIKQKNQRKNFKNNQKKQNYLIITKINLYFIYNFIK